MREGRFLRERDFFREVQFWRDARGQEQQLIFFLEFYTTLVLACHGHGPFIRHKFFPTPSCCSSCIISYPLLLKSCQAKMKTNNNSPTTSAATTKSPPTVYMKQPRRSKRQENASFGTRKSARTLKRRHAGNNARVYGDDYGILPSD